MGKKHYASRKNYTTKAVLTLQPVYLLIVINVAKETLNELDKIRKRFLWAGEQALTGRKCKVNWPMVNRPKDLGRVLDIHKFASALRVQWLWKQQSDPGGVWAGLGNPRIDIDKLLYATCTELQLGGGRQISFWHNAWAEGQRPKDVAPRLYQCSKRKIVPSKMHFKTSWATKINLQNLLSDLSVNNVQ